MMIKWPPTAKVSRISLIITWVERREAHTKAELPLINSQHESKQPGVPERFGMFNYFSSLEVNAVTSSHKSIEDLKTMFSHV